MDAFRVIRGQATHATPAGTVYATAGTREEADAWIAHVAPDLRDQFYVEERTARHAIAEAHVAWAKRHAPHLLRDEVVSRR
jgi:hypothetical protein